MKQNKLNKKYEDAINKAYDRLLSKTSKISKQIDNKTTDTKIDNFLLESNLEDKWDKYCRTQGVCSKDFYPYKEERDINKIYLTHKNHPSIEIPIEAKKIVDHFKVNSRTDKEIVQSICKWVSTYIDYDNEHAAASRLYKQGKNLIYMNATEVFNTRTGICGETSLLIIGMLNHAGIPSTIYRPWFSHIAVIAKTKLNQHFMCDPTYNKFEETLPITKKSSKESYYEIGVSNIIDNYKWNWEKRRNKGLEYSTKHYGKELTPYELLDIERALLCEPLKYGTIVGFVEQNKMIPTCRKLEEERKKLEEQLKKETYQYKDYNRLYKDEYENEIDLNEWNQWKDLIR